MPPKQADPGPDVRFVIPPIEPPKPWYRKRWVQVGLVGGVVAVIAGSIVLSNSLGAEMRGGVTWEGGVGEATNK
jgi:hypothetical protein